MPVTADDIARELRNQIRQGVLSPGDRMPTLDALERQYSVATETVRLAVNTLRFEGLVETVGGRGGTVVRRRPERLMVARDRTMQRDAHGYFSSPEIKGWARVGMTTAESRPVPADVARLLGVEPEAETLVRARTVAHPEHSELRHRTEAWIHPDVVAELPVLASNTGPGGSLDRIEEHYNRPLGWSEIVTAHAASPEERELLVLPLGVPVLRVLRVGTIGRSSRVAMVDDFRMSAELFGVRYSVGRAQSARWPTTPAQPQEPDEHATQASNG